MGTGASSSSLRSTVNTAVSTTRWKKNVRSTSSNLAPAEKETSRSSSQKDLKAEDRYFIQHRKTLFQGFQRSSVNTTDCEDNAYQRF